MIRRLNWSLAAFPRFVLHDLRLNARALASMFGASSLRRLAIFVVLMFLGLHVAAYPLAGWLIQIEDGPDGAERIMAILAGGAALIIPWIVGQSIADFTRTLFGRSGSRVDPRLARRCSLSPRRPRFVDCGRGRRVGGTLYVGPARRCRSFAWSCALAGALSGPDCRGARRDWLRGHCGDGAQFGGGPATRAPLRPDCRDRGRRVRRAWGADSRDAARWAASDDFRPRRHPASAARAAPSLLMAPARAAAGDAQAILVWAAFGATVFALACMAFGERFARAAIASAGAPPNAGVAAKGQARFGASASAARRIKERRVVWRDPWLMSQLLLQAAYTTPLAVILWRGGGPKARSGSPSPRRSWRSRPTRGRALLDRAFGRGCARFPHDRSPVASRRRTGQDRGDWPADRAHPRLAACRIGLRLALGRAMRASVRRRSDRLGRADQSLATGPISSRARASTSFAVEARGDDGAPGLDPVGGGDDDRRDRVVGDCGPSRRRRRRPGAQPKVGGFGLARACVTAPRSPYNQRALRLSLSR